MATSHTFSGLTQNMTSHIRTSTLIALFIILVLLIMQPWGTMDEYQPTPACQNTTEERCP